MSSQDPTVPDMAASAKSMLAKARQLVPPMLDKFHKGQLGRVAVIGGSADYTGAPYFSAMASARLGCDLSYVICEPSAAPTIKSYSPNLMVSPLLRSSQSISPDRQESQDLAGPIIEMLPRIHVLVIGPGLGRDPITLDQVSSVILAAQRRSPAIPLVIDADGLYLINQQPDLIKGYKNCILTPNVVEFARLAQSLGIDRDDASCDRLANALGGVCILQKGPEDHISAGAGTVTCSLTGGRKRSGGQGDTLTGVLGTFMAWRKAYHEGLWSRREGEEEMDSVESLLVAAYAGSAVTRECSRRAFVKRGRSLQASDLTEEVSAAFLNVVGEPTRVGEEEE